MTFLIRLKFLILLCFRKMLQGLVLAGFPLTPENLAKWDPFFSNRDLRNFQKESGISVLEKSKKNEQHGLGYNHFCTATNKKVFCTVRVRFTAQYSQKNGLKYIWKCISKVRDKLEKYWKSQGKVSEFCIEGKSGIPLLGIVWYHEQFLNKFFYALRILLVGKRSCIDTASDRDKESEKKSPRNTRSQ